MPLRSPRMPDVLVIGAQKAATTWLHVNLGWHPDVWMTPAKEVHFFDSLEPERADLSRRFRLSQYDSFCERDARAKTPNQREHDWFRRYAFSETIDEVWYASLFEGVDQSLIAGESTPSYSHIGADTVAYVRGLLSDAKIIYVMREPIQQTWSQALLTHRHQVERGDELSPATMFAGIDQPPDRVMCDYRWTITNWERHFPSQQILYMLYDDLVTDSRQFLRTVCAFMGIEYSDEFFPLRSQRRNESPLRPVSEEFCRLVAKREIGMLYWLNDKLDGRVSHWVSEAERWL